MKIESFLKTLHSYNDHYFFLNIKKFETNLIVVFDEDFVLS